MGLSNDDKICKEITNAVNVIFGTKYKWQDLQEWSSGKIDPRDDEVIHTFEVGGYKGINVAFKKPEEK